MNVLERLLQEDFLQWDALVADYEQQNRILKVPAIDRTALHYFNYHVEELYTKSVYDFGRARRNRDAIQRLLKTVIDDYYKGSNDQARKAAGIQFARNYPVPEYFPFSNVNLFDMEDQFIGYFNAMEATIKSLEAKAGAKITNNSLLNLENTIVPV
jgi:hypothetical protein